MGLVCEINGKWLVGVSSRSATVPCRKLWGCKVNGAFHFLTSNMTMTFARVDDFLLTFYKRLLLDDKNWKRAKWRHVLPEPEL